MKPPKPVCIISRNRSPSLPITRRRQPATRQETCHIRWAGTSERTTQRPAERTTLRLSGENGAACDRLNSRSRSSARHRCLRIRRSAGRREGSHRQQERPTPRARLQPDCACHLDRRGCVPTGNEQPRTRTHGAQHIRSCHGHLDARTPRCRTTPTAPSTSPALATPITTPITRESSGQQHGRGELEHPYPPPRLASEAQAPQRRNRLVRPHLSPQEQIC
jgi:hypothetical protein